MNIHYQFFCWEITKYSPAYRNKQGHYLIDEWTDYSCIGMKICDKVITYEQYAEIEQRYIKSIQLLIHKLQVKELRFQFFQKNKIKFDQNTSESMKHLYNSLTKKTTITPEIIVTLYKLIFRNYIFAIVRSVDIIILVDDDYYLTVGTSEECLDTIEEIKKMGLFPRRLDYYEAIGQYHDGDPEDTCSA